MQTYASFRRGSAATRLRLALYYLHRIVTSRTLRHIGHRVLVAALRVHRGAAHPPAQGARHPAAGLRAAGCLRLGPLLSRAQCDDMLRYLDDKVMVDARGSGRRFRLGEVPQEASLGDYPLETIVACPHLLQIANDPAVIGLVSDYLGFTPTIVSLGLRWSFPQAARAGTAADTVQRFHRDSEPGSTKLLIYLTDVDSDCGPHVYVEGSHRERMPMRLRPYADAEVARKYASVTSIEGEAGTGFLIDTKGIHKGAAPLRKPRLLLGIQYALLPCFLYEYAPVQCRQAGQFDRHINRLMITEEAAPAPAPAVATQTSDEPLREPTPVA
ncbi:phytanoyl-CoA dioxygenase family protein [Massilia sp. 9096]|uniref:phytanoyl-CoA dioxygenase family protein n=1 Tax=Massilia sp. 9096 TaxID=1500894 RepID=UPI00068BE6CD|nr:phytanoyl-CoA dioxygenase family protein [Massilia sp. 9096]